MPLSIGSNMNTFEECKLPERKLSVDLDTFFFEKEDGSICQESCRDLIVFYYWGNLSKGKELGLYYVFGSEEKMLKACNFVTAFDNLIDKKSRITIQVSKSNFRSWWPARFVLNNWWVKDRIVLSLLTALIRSGVDYDGESCIDYLGSDINKWTKKYFSEKSLNNLKYLLSEKKYTFTERALKYFTDDCTCGWCWLSDKYEKEIFK